MSNVVLVEIIYRFRGWVTKRMFLISKILFNNKHIKHKPPPKYISIKIKHINNKTVHPLPTLLFNVIVPVLDMLVDLHIPLSCCSEVPYGFVTQNHQFFSKWYNGHPKISQILEVFLYFLWDYRASHYYSPEKYDNFIFCPI